MKQLTKLNIFQLEKFKNHPYSVKHDESFFELVESIKENGLINPIVVRPIADKTFEIVSGHRRKEAIEYLGLFEIDAYIEELNDYEATILMVDSNIQREMVLPSEKAFAYKMKLEAQKVLGVPSGHRAREIVSKGGEREPNEYSKIYKINIFNRGAT